MKRLIRVSLLALMFSAAGLWGGFCEDQALWDVQQLTGDKKDGLYGGFGDQEEVMFAYHLTLAESRYYRCVIAHAK